MGAQNLKIILSNMTIVILKNHSLDSNFRSEVNYPVYP